MEDFKKEIAATIEMPDFIKVYKNIGYHEVVDIVYKILDLYYRGVEESGFLCDTQVLRIVRRISFLYRQIEIKSTSEIFFSCSIWIGDTVTKWIKIAVKVENYEAATNLRKLLNEEYE